MMQGLYFVRFELQVCGHRELLPHVAGQLCQTGASEVS